MVASMFGTNLQSDAVLFEGVIQVESFSRDGMSMGHHVPTGFPVLILRPALRHGRVTVYDFEIHKGWPVDHFCLCHSMVVPRA